MAPAPDGGVYVVNQTGVHALAHDGSQKWNFPSTNFTSGPVLAAGGALYVGTQSNGLIALDAAGQQLWSAPVEGMISGTPAVGQDGGIFFGTSAGNFHAVNADGSGRWVFHAGSPIRVAPAITPQGQVLFGTDGGLVWALRADTVLADTPWPKYQRDLSNQGRAASSQVVPGAVPELAAQVQSPGGTVIHLTWSSAVEAQTYEVWRAKGNDFVNAALVASNLTSSLRFDDDAASAGVTYGYWVRGVNLAGVGPFSGPVLAVQTNQLWAVPFSDFAPVVDGDGTIFAGAIRGPDGAHGSIVAYDNTGAPGWVYQDEDIIMGAPALTVDGRLVFPSYARGGCARAVTHSGQLAWTTPIGRPASGADAAVDAYGTAYLSSSHGTLYSLNALTADGYIVPLLSCSDEPMDHAVIGQGGRIYVATRRMLSAASGNGDAQWYAGNGNSPWLWGTPAINASDELVLGAMTYSGPSLLRMTDNLTVLASNVCWRIWWQSPHREPALSADGRTYLLMDNTLVCADADGVIAWTNRFQNPLVDGLANAPALDKAGNVYVAASQELVVIDRTGTKIGQFELGRSPTAPPVLTLDGRLYVSAGGKLHAFTALAGLDSNAPWPMYRHDPFGTACAQRSVSTPEAPSRLTPKPFANRVRIVCGATPVPAALELYRGTTTNFPDAVLVARARAGEPFVDDTNAAPGVVYYYWARLQNAGGTSGFSGPVPAFAVEVPVKWFAPIADLGPVAPAIGPDGTVYTCATNRLVALNSDGSTRWQLGGYTGAPLANADGAVVIRSGDRVCSLSAGGTTNWTIAGITAWGGLVPALGADGRTIIHRADDDLAAISSDGTPIWEKAYQNYSLGAPSIAGDGSVVFLRGELARLNPDGSEAGSVALSGYYQTTSAPVLDGDGTVYLPCASPLCLRATQSNGSNKWDLSSSEPISTPPVVGGDGTVFTAYSERVQVSPPKYLRKIAAVRANGLVSWSLATEQNVQPFLGLTAEGALLAAGGTSLVALAAEDGHQLWQMDSPNGQAFGPPVLDYDGTLYAPVGGGILALRLGVGPAASAWPMFRQNPRQSACIQRGIAPEIRAISSQSGNARLEFQACGGCVVLKSYDLRYWQRAAFQPATNGPVCLEPDMTLEPAAFYRLISP